MDDGRRVSLLVLFLMVGVFSGRMVHGTPPPEEGTEPRSVYLDTSFDAEQALERARQLEEDGQWIEASARLQQVIREYGRHVITVGPDQYVSIYESVGRRISGWPDEGLEVYRRAFEPAARTALAAAQRDDDLAALLHVADEYFATQSGAAAREILARRAAPAAPVHEEATAPDACSPSVFCGAAHRRGRFSCDASPEAILWKHAKSDATEDRVDDADDHYREAGGRRDRFGSRLDDAHARALETGSFLSRMPVAGGGLIYLHDGHTVWAVDPLEPTQAVWTREATARDTDGAAWLHDDTSPALSTALYVAGSPGAPPSTSSKDETPDGKSPHTRDGGARGRLYVHLLGPRADDGGKEQNETGTALACLDAATGRILWWNGLKELASAFEEASLDGAPILHEGQVYAVGRRRKSFGFEACYLLRLDPEDGRLLNMIHVGEAATGSYGYRRATTSHPAAAGDRVFVQSNLGSIAAVRAVDGRTLWIRTYESVMDREGDTTWSELSGRPIRSWSYHPVVCWGDSVVSMPLDAKELFLLNQQDGRVIRKLSVETLEHPETILGIDGDLLYLVGSYVVCYDLAADRIAWKRPVEQGRLLGRGALTDTGVLIPTDRALLQYPLEGGRAHTYPWPLEQAGHVLPLSDQIVIASPQMLYGLVRRGDAFARLTKRMSDMPENPWIALDLAELAFQTGDAARGLEAVEEAVRRLGGFARMTDTASRHRLMNRLTHFAESLLSKLDESDSPSSSTAVVLLGLSGQCAATPEEQVVQRFLLGRAQVLTENVAGAVETYQQILSDPGLRRVPLRDTSSYDFLSPDALASLHDASDASVFEWDLTALGSAAASTDGVVAGRFAASRIGVLIRLHGPSVYETIDQKARDRLKIARGLAEPSAALEVAEAFPNSSASTEALSLHARWMHSAGDHRTAARSYRRALRDRRHADRSKLLEEYVACLLADGRREDAVDWLARGSRDDPDYLLTGVDGRYRFATYRAHLLESGARTNPAHAVTVGPVTKTYDRLFPDRVTALEPLMPGLPKTSWDDVFTVSGNQLDCRNSLTGRSRWPRPFMTPSHPVLLGLDDSHAYLATPSRIFALTRTSGQLAWQFGEEPPDDPMVEPEMVPIWLHHSITGDRLYSASDRGRVVSLSLSDGTLRWRVEVGSAPSAPILADERYVYCAVSQGVQLSVLVLDAHDGRQVRTLQPADSWPLQSLLLTREGGLLLIRSTTLQYFDVDAGVSRWHVTTPEHYYLATLQTDADALYVSTDARRITAYDLENGRILWRSGMVGPRADQGIWAQLAGGMIFTACADRMQCLDAADGRVLWEVAAPGCLKVQAPRVTADSVVTISPVEAPRPLIRERVLDRRDDGPRAERDEAGRDETGRRYQIRRYCLDTGAELPLAENGLLTGPIASFGGMLLRNHAILLLDGPRLIGHVGQNPE